nr:hypothetical protein [Candidatus Freyrarchaeum guaymaensis]
MVTGLKDELLKKAMSFYPNHPDLMKHLKVGSIWEYRVFSPTLDGEEILVFHLMKMGNSELALKEGGAPEKPDLILYFTVKAMLQLIENSKNAHEYYREYRRILEEPSREVELDYKINKNRLKLWRAGYREWANEFGFTKYM